MDNDYFGLNNFNLPSIKGVAEPMNIWKFVTIGLAILLSLFMYFNAQDKKRIITNQNELINDIHVLFENEKKFLLKFKKYLLTEHENPKQLEYDKPLEENPQLVRNQQETYTLSPYNI